MRSLPARTCGKARAVLDAAQEAADDADPAVRTLSRCTLTVPCQAMGVLGRQGAGLLRAGLCGTAGPPPPTTAHRGQGAVRAVQHILDPA
ncbi:hypothetical protein [Streptomyces sp. NRRL S-340]|uniref:hypothetical protein n=1 Tax=Streptomyces sp. NRRL S-340 TaxID=1463901 RepID=UPI000561A2D1|nr:hypothetical protein [Streptomyces sp. NRRL S-340]